MRARREKQATDTAKKDGERNKVALTDFEKGLLRIESVATRVGGVVGAIGGALAGSAVFNNIAGVASSYSRLLTESQRSGASPKNINALVYSLSQRGVDKGTARSSFDTFARTIQQSPGLKALLAGAGVDMKGDTAEIFAKLGTYFNSMPPQTALAMAGRFGIDQDTLNALKKGDVAEGMQGYGNIAGSFGLDPDKASRDARDFSNAYDHLAEDLHTIQAKIADNFYKPLTAAMTELSHLLEGNGDKATALGTAFEGLSLTLAVSLLPRLLKITSLLSALSIPAWLARFLVAYTAGGAVLSEQSAAAIQNSKPGTNDVYVDPESGLATPVAPGAGNQVTGAPDAGKDGLLGWYRRHAPTWAGGTPEAAGGEGRTTRAGAAGGSNADMDARGMASMDYLINKKGWQPAGAALAVGNAQQESGVRSDGPAGDPSTPGGSHYMFQWNNGRNNDTIGGRRAKYEAWARANNRDPRDMYASLDYMDEERKQRSAIERDWDKQTDLSNGADISRAYEGYGDNSTGTRLGNAARWLNKWKSHTSEPPPPAAASPFKSVPGYPKMTILEGAPEPGSSDASPQTVGKPPSLRHAPPTLAGAGIKIGPGGYALNPDGTPTMNNFDPKTGMVTAPPGPQSYNTRGDTNYTQNIHVTGVQKPQEVADAIKPVARRGAQDHIRFMEGNSG